MCWSELISDDTIQRELAAAYWELASAPNTERGGEIVLQASGTAALMTALLAAYDRPLPWAAGAGDASAYFRKLHNRYERLPQRRSFQRSHVAPARLLLEPFLAHGELPSGTPTPPNWADYRWRIIKPRLETALNRILADSTTADSAARHRARLEHEAQIFASLAEMTRRKLASDGAPEQVISLGSEFAAATRELLSDVRTQDSLFIRVAARAAEKSCIACHSGRQ